MLVTQAKLNRMEVHIMSANSSQQEIGVIVVDIQGDFTMWKNSQTRIDLEQNAEFSDGTK